jgi:methylthioribose-1-phosphate isomerase
VTPIDLSKLPIEWLGDRVRMIDQTRLPHEEIYLELDEYGDVISAIKEMRIRGAPAIGIAGAYAVVLGALKIKAAKRETFLEKLNTVIEAVAASRPTARNLFFALERLRRAAAGQDVPEIKDALVKEAIGIHADEADATRHISLLGAELLKDGWTVLTHCNTGPLATSGQGTALGVIVAAHRQGKNIKVLVDETRPLLQGARLTAWELQKASVPGTLITDSMAGYFMKLGKVDCVITGADRIAANGDTANKVGTYTLAVLAGENNVPLYIAAPTSTIDLSLATGDDIPIEERDASEVTHFHGVPVAPEDLPAANPAFDVTPHCYITAIITEKGIAREPYGDGLRAIMRAQAA